MCVCVRISKNTLQNGGYFPHKFCQADLFEFLQDFMIFLEGIYVNVMLKYLYFCILYVVSLYVVGILYG